MFFTEESDGIGPAKPAKYSIPAKCTKYVIPVKCVRHTKIVKAVKNSMWSDLSGIQFFYQ